MPSGNRFSASRHAYARLFLAASTAVAVLFAAACASTDSPPRPRGLTPIFDGATLNGWTPRGGNASYTVEEDCIVGRTAPNQPNSFLCTTRGYRDFELELYFKVDPALNSGIQVRSQSLPDYKNGVVHGYQIEIDPSSRAWTGGLYDESRRGWLVDLADKPEARAAFLQGQWNHLRITVRGDTFNTWLNGVPVVQNFHDSMTPEGFIALQVHGVGDRKEPLEIRWKNIRIREF